MLNTQILNLIIIVSVIGISLMSAQDYFFPSQTNVAAVRNDIIVSPSPSPIPPTTTPKDPHVSCDHPYFPSEIGTTWKYNLTASLTAGEQTKTTKSTLVNTVVARDDSSITIESVLGKEASSTARLICRESGIYGFPFPLIPMDITEFITSKVGVLSQFGLGVPKIKIDQSIRLIPGVENTKIGTTWRNTLGIDLDLPIAINAFSLNLVNTIADEKEATVSGFGKTTALTVNATTDSKDLVPGETPVTYQMTEGVGMTNMETNLEKEGMGSLKATLTLVSFTTPKPSVTPTLFPTAAPTTPQVQ